MSWGPSGQLPCPNGCERSQWCVSAEMLSMQLGTANEMLPGSRTNLGTGDKRLIFLSLGLF